MNEKLFKALEEGNLNGGNSRDTPSGGLRRKDFNSTSASILGAEAVESMQKHHAEQIQMRAEELEEKLKTKDKEIERLSEQVT